MSDELWRPDASFRGVPFVFVAAKGKTGRRALPHEYPKRDGGYSEDNGGVLNNEVVQAILVGANAETEFKQLLNALNVAGPGELVHPYFGLQQVQIGDVNYDLNNNERYKASLSFTIYTAVETFSPTQTVDTQQQTADAASTAEMVNNAQFTKKVNELSPLQNTTLTESIDTALTDLDKFTTGLPSLPTALGEWVDRLDKFKGSTARLIAYPGEIARDLTSLITDVKDLVTEMPQALNVYDQLVQTWDGLLTEVSLEPIDSADVQALFIQQAKKIALVFTRNAAVIAKTQVIASIDSNDVNGGFHYSQQAQATATLINEQLQQLAEQSIESDDRDGWRAFRVLRTAIADDLTVRIQQLPHLKVVSPSRTVPIALLAYQQTGDTSNRDMLVQQNQLSRPSFITPHHSIEFVAEEKNNG